MNLSLPEGRRIADAKKPAYICTCLPEEKELRRTTGANTVRRAAVRRAMVPGSVMERFTG